MSARKLLKDHDRQKRKMPLKREDLAVFKCFFLNCEDKSCLDLDEDGAGVFGVLGWEAKRVCPLNTLLLLLVLLLLLSVGGGGAEEERAARRQWLTDLRRRRLEGQEIFKMIFF